MPPPLSPLEKEDNLIRQLRLYPNAALAYSGGVDSSYLADVAFEVLGDKLLLLIADTPTMPRAELAAALELAKERGWCVKTFQSGEFENPEFLTNSPQRCYHCKGEIFASLAQQAAREGISILLHGENADDAFDTTRVGVLAAKEAGAIAPLADQGFTKDDIRQRSKVRNLNTWNKAAFACLATRIPTNMPITRDLLHQIEKAETILQEAGFHQYRARHHGDLCRIEVEEKDMARFLDPALRKTITEKLRHIGYSHVTLDLKGYGTHS